MYVDLFIWIIFWFGIFGFSNQVLRKKGYTYTNRFLVTIVFFLFSNILVFFFFRDYFSSFFTIGFNYISFLIMFFSITFFIYWLLRNFTEFRRGISGFEYTYIKYSFLVSKGFEILLQDLLLISLLYIFRVNFISNNIYFVLAFTLFFGLVHLPLVIIKPGRGSWFLVIVCFTLGIILPLIYLLDNFDFIYLYIAHWLFYIIGGIFYRVAEPFRNVLDDR